MELVVTTDASYDVGATPLPERFPVELTAACLCTEDDG